MITEMIRSLSLSLHLRVQYDNYEQFKGILDLKYNFENELGNKSEIKLY